MTCTTFKHKYFTNLIHTTENIMKKTFLLMLFVLTAMVGESFAQDAQVAMLYHKNGMGNTESFYGYQALISALNNANQGDVISLSGATFLAPSQISIGITIRGAGMKADAALGTLPTIIQGNLRLTSNGKITIEGIYHNGNIDYSTSISSKFIKCRLNNIEPTVSTSKMTDAQFVQCKIAGQLALNGNSTATCINSVVNNPTSIGSVGTSLSSYGRFIFTNCVLYTNSPVIRSSVFVNSVIYDNLSNGEGVFDSSNVMNYNVGCSTGGLNIFPQNDTNVSFPSPNDFVNGLELTIDGEMDALDYVLGRGRFYLGGDGTQVGIYGGTLPFDPKVTGPRITQATVGSQTTSDGKLSVDITVSAQ